MIEFIQQYQILLLSLSILGFVGSLIVIPWILIKLPSDYFYAEKRKTCPWGHCPPIIRLIILVIKNIVGLVLMISGIVMLFTPGQGILTIIGGIIFMDFSYKYKLLRWFINRPKVLSSINNLRIKSKQRPLEV